MGEPVGAIAAAVVPTLTYKSGWRFKIGGPLSGSMCVYATTVDSGHRDRQRTTQHQFVFVEGQTRPEFVRWVFDCLLLCEQHETGEFFEVGGVAPMFPHHQDEGSPYDIVDRTEALTWP